MRRRVIVLNVDEQEPEVRLSRVAKALGNPTRVAIIRSLATGGPRITQDIVREIGLAQSTVSEHLRILREAELVATSTDGPRVWYDVRPAVLCRFAGGVEALVEDSLVDGS